MRMHRRAWLLVAVLAALCAPREMRSAEQAGWKVGVARAKITPDKPMLMAGYASRTHAAEGTLQDLWVKVLTLEAPDGGRALVVTDDLLELPKAVADRLAEEIGRRCGVQRAQIMLTSSHTHCGPVLQNNLPEIYPWDDKLKALTEQYTRQLEKTVVATAATATAQMLPATLWAGQGTTGFAVNRRNNREKDLKAAPLRGPVDHAVPVLAVRTPGGKLCAVAMSYACHNTTLDLYQWCGDYAGFAQCALEGRHPGMTAMFYEGCAGDQNPLPRRSVELCRKYGQMLADAVEQVVAQPMRPIAPRLRTAFTTIPLEFCREPNVKQLEKLAEKQNYMGRWATRLLADWKQGKPRPGPYPYPVQVWKLGDDQLWISLGGEAVVDYALRFKARYGSRTWVNGYANDVMGYIPSHRVWQEGGYEAGAFPVYNLPADRWAEDIEQRIAAAVDRLVQQVNH